MHIEVSHLLQRMETYQGVAIISTNMKRELDKTFLRRLRFIVQFTTPDVKRRKAIWRGVFPSFARLNRRKEFISVTEINGSNLKSFGG